MELPPSPLRTAKAIMRDFDDDGFSGELFDARLGPRSSSGLNYLFYNRVCN